jgi:hypothetical protein
VERIDIRDLDFDALACAGRALPVQGLMPPPQWPH